MQLWVSITAVPAARTYWVSFIASAETFAAAAAASPLPSAIFIVNVKLAAVTALLGGATVPLTTV